MGSFNTEMSISHILPFKHEHYHSREEKTLETVLSPKFAAMILAKPALIETQSMNMGDGDYQYMCILSSNPSAPNTWELMITFTKGKICMSMSMLYKTMGRVSEPGKLAFQYAAKEKYLVRAQKEIKTVQDIQDITSLWNVYSDVKDENIVPFFVQFVERKNIDVTHFQKKQK
jgi:hypothetical protein